MWISRATIGGLAAVAGLGALAMTPAEATDLYIESGSTQVYVAPPQVYGTQPQVYAAPQVYGAPRVYAAPQVYAAPGPVYGAPAPAYEAYPEDGYGVEATPRVIVRPAPRHVIMRERVPAGAYVRDVPIPPAPVGGYYDGGYPDEATYDQGCRPITRETPSGRLVTVGSTCD